MAAYRRMIVVLGIMGCAAWASSSAASWPMARHDPKRTGAATGASNITTPVAYWRAYLGGTLGPGQLLTSDVNGDGTPDLIIAGSGRISAKSATDTTYWTATNGIDRLAAVGDLDGDGQADLVAYSSDAAYVLSAATGGIEWREPVGEIGTMGSVRVGDVTGDGKPDIIITECGCCGVNSGNSGYIYSFGAGFAAPVKSPLLPVFSCGTSYSVTLGDADGKAGSEILLADYSHFALLDGAGGVLAETASQGDWVSLNECVAQDVDGVPGTEFVCIQNTGLSPATNERKITVLHYDPVAAALNVVWSKTVAPDAGGDMRWVDPVVDLDGDGTFEIVISVLDPNAGWQTLLLDAATGSTLVPPIGGGNIIQGTAQLEAPGKRLALTLSGNTLSAWRFSRSPSPTVAQAWQVTDRSVLSYADPKLFATTAVNTRAAAVDLDGDGLDEVIVRNLSGAAAIMAYSVKGGSPSILSTRTLDPGSDSVGAWIVPGITTVSPQVAFAETAGLLSILAPTLATSTVDGLPAAVRIGGYYGAGGWREFSNTPRLAALTGSSKTDSILVTDSRLALERLDPQNASLAVPPKPTWSVAETFAPTIVTTSGGKSAAACVGVGTPVTNPPTYRVRLVGGDGAILWDVPASSNPMDDLVPGDFNGDGVTDLAFEWAAPSSAVLQATALSGIDGTPLWTTPAIDPGPGGVESSGLSVGRYVGTNHDDVYLQALGTRILNGATGAQAAQGGQTTPYSLPMLVDTTGDTLDEVVLTGGYWPVSLYTHDLQTALWTSTDDDRPYPYAAVAQCNGVPTLVQGSWAHPARLKTTPLAGGALGAFATITLAHGKLYTSESAAEADGTFLGQLTSANVHANLTGQGRPTAVVGSSEGWLYGIDPCKNTLDFALNFGAAVGEPVFGDTDGDGRDEIILTAADGYLYDVKNQAIASPSWVWDLDPSAPGDQDVDTITATNELAGKWAPVQGATAYEITAVTKDGTPLTTPTWTNVGNVTTATLNNLKLDVGVRYYFAVHALGPNGASVDTLSDGVVVSSGSAVDAGADVGGDGGQPPATGGGCSCDVTRTDGSPGGVLAAALGLLGAIGLRRRVRHAAAVGRSHPGERRA